MMAYNDPLAQTKACIWSHICDWDGCDVTSFLLYSQNLSLLITVKEPLRKRRDYCITEALLSGFIILMLKRGLMKAKMALPFPDGILKYSGLFDLFKVTRSSKQKCKKVFSKLVLKLYIFKTSCIFLKQNCIGDLGHYFNNLSA